MGFPMPGTKAPDGRACQTTFDGFLPATRSPGRGLAGQPATPNQRTSQPATRNAKVRDKTHPDHHCDRNSASGSRVVGPGYDESQLNLEADIQ